MKKVQRLANIKISKAFRTVSHEALCIFTELMPITTNLKEITHLYNIKKDGKYDNMYIDTVLHYSNWPHPADIVTLNPANKEGNHTLTYTDGSK